MIDDADSSFKTRLVDPSSLAWPCRSKKQGHIESDAGSCKKYRIRSRHGEDGPEPMWREGEREAPHCQQNKRVCGV